jgi:hypothetical protein
LDRTASSSSRTRISSASISGSFPSIFGPPSAEVSAAFFATMSAETRRRSRQTETSRRSGVISSNQLSIVNQTAAASSSGFAVIANVTVYFEYSFSAEASICGSCDVTGYTSNFWAAAKTPVPVRRRTMWPMVL